MVLEQYLKGLFNLIHTGWITFFREITEPITVEPRLSGLVGTRRNSPDNRGSG